MLKNNVCDVQEFEYTPVQRFVAQFMSPDTPYNGMLLYHGVGVGKTCAAILAAEAFLDLTPKNKVYILAPPAIQPGFYRTIFDSSRIKFGADSNVPNQHEGCTGNRYLDLTQTYFERELKDIEFRVNKLINKRYAIMGYVAFRNMVREILSQIPSTLSDQRQRELESSLLKKAFSGSLIIVDEAHNLRDVAEDEADQLDESGADDQGDASAGKKLAPQLRKVLRTCDGNKLLLMTATPMYNNYKEIISLLNFLLHADHADESKLLTDSIIQFQKDERGVEVLKPESEQRLIQIANGHVSFMRGENPRAFPARLDPDDAFRVKTWPAMTPNGTTRIEPEQQKEDVLRLPLVKCELAADGLAIIKDLTERLVAAKGVGIRTVDTLLQAGNCVFPGEGMEGRTGSEGFQSWFSATSIPGTFEGTRLSNLPQYAPADPTANYTWMSAGRNALGKYSPKFNRILQSIQTARGISFVYSRFVENGAVLFCLILEANGYSPWGRSAPLFKKGPVANGRQCSRCQRREIGHPAFNNELTEDRDNHTFSPAYYALLTASNINTVERESMPLSPNNPRVVSAARDLTNVDGSKIKVIVGSQVAGEGLDLKAIREIHILEGWFHLSKEEQIVGRGIRYCSHQGLEANQRNCTINLYVNVFPPEVNKETIDQYSYRTAMNKAVRVGNVSRALKQGAADCNLNRETILVAGLDPVEMENSQGKLQVVNLNDRDFTPICDWIHCSYECVPKVDFRGLEENTSTYDIYAARFAEQTMIARLKKLFSLQPWYRWEDLQRIFGDIPKQTLTSLLMRVVNNTSIVFENGNMQGRLLYRNNLFIFQPSSIQDTYLPIALRHGRYPIKRDSYQPDTLQAAPKAVKPKATVRLGAKATVLAEAPAADALAPSDLAEAAAEALAPSDAPSIEPAMQFWNTATKWIDIWAADTATPESILEFIPDTEDLPLSRSILNYVDRDYSKKDNIESRLKKLQWWGKAIAAVPGGLADLRAVAKQFIWDSFLKGIEQIGILKTKQPAAVAAGDEQYKTSGSIEVHRYLDIATKEPIYICGEAVCPPSVLQLFTSSKTDPVITAKANQRVTAELYGFMVPWENNIMFKTNEPKPEGKDPGGGAACAIVSNVKGHRMKLIKIGEILERYTGQSYDLTEEVLTGSRKLTGAPNFCALTEIVFRWMDKRKASYGNLKYFYRPLSAYYSNHRSRK